MLCGLLVIDGVLSQTECESIGVCNACTMMRFLYHLIDHPYKNIIISVSYNLISPVNVFDYVIADSTEL